jgi:hypothetical protein
LWKRRRKNECTTEEICLHRRYKNSIPIKDKGIKKSEEDNLSYGEEETVNGNEDLVVLN